MNKTGCVPLIIRLSFQGNKVDKATGFYVNPDEWNVGKQRMKGRTEQSIQVNEWIDETLVRISDAYREEVRESNAVHLPTVMASLFAGAKEEPALLKLMQEHNDKIKERVGNDYTFSTYEKYVFTYNKVKTFVEKRLNVPDILLRDLTAKFIVDFDHYLRAHDKNQHNTAVKYCINLKSILNTAVLMGILDKSPFSNYKTVYKDTKQVYLEEHEVITLENIELIKPNHTLARDLFLFQCSTGLAYTDMIHLGIADITTDNSGRKWIIKARQKSGIVSTIPLLPKALEIIDKYCQPMVNQPLLFPHYSIQKYNQYIGEVGTIAGIHKKLSSHVGRRTFGNIALARGVSLNVISKILGHSNTLITQRIYAITTQNIITGEIEKW